MTQTLPLEVRFLKRYTRRLHEAGVPAHQLEGLVRSVARAVGLRCDVWSSPTAVLLAFQRLDDDEDTQPVPMQLIRLQPGSINLAHTTALYRLAEEIVEGRKTLETAHAEVRDADAAPLHPGVARLLGNGVISGSLAVMLGAGWTGVLAAAVAGLAVGALIVSESRALRQGTLDAVAGVLVTLLVYLLNRGMAGIDPAVTIMSGLIVLMPGLSLTIAVTELSTDHLSSGSARLAGALVTLLKLALGVVIGTVIARWLTLDQPGLAWAGAGRPAEWLQWPALLLAGLGFGVLFNVAWRDVPLAMGAAVVSYVVSRFGSHVGGVEFGVLLAAFVVAVLGNLLGRALRRPASLIRVPGIILLVPGAMGYRTVTNVLLHGAADPQETVLLVAILVVSLVGGLLIGNTVLPPRRHI